ncbi:chitobiase/beta-hexosaminidase C-terminal domain-containing protein [Candidatus Pacearchaeota archaeon]|jgi:hypothetical protein|nr:chitobiase/beta-hexosaminidase C-terminal domain-containing protein [Candidatus Pacearchaeota archaeon]
MSTITISIEESPLQLLAGIPSTVTLDSNTPATIFYTLDGTEPTTDSLVALGPIEMPTDRAYVALRAFATDGTSYSPIITQEYKTNVIGGRNPHDTAYTHQSTGATYPFGDQVESGGCTTFGNTAGVIVDEQGDPTRQPDGYDGTATGTGAGYYIPPKSKYQVLFSETDAIGQTGKGIGTMPGRVLWVKPRNDNTRKQSTNMQRPLFDPKALVIFQDSSEEPYDPSVPKINRPYFDLEDQAKARDGSMLTITDAITPAGSFLKAHYNPTHNTMTYYYYDNRVSRWIISTEPYHQNQNPTSNLAGIVTRSSRGQGVGMIFKWIPFKYRRLT